MSTHVIRLPRTSAHPYCNIQKIVRRKYGQHSSVILRHKNIRDSKGDTRIVRTPDSFITDNRLKLSYPHLHADLRDPDFRHRLRHINRTAIWTGRVSAGIRPGVVGCILSDHHPTDKTRLRRIPTSQLFLEANPKCAQIEISPRGIICRKVKRVGRISRAKVIKVGGVHIPCQL